MKHACKTAGLLAIVALTATMATAADKSSSTMDPKAMMAMMQKYGMPGANHQILQQSVGRWSYTVRSWMKPGDTPMESQGTSVNTLLLGGRFLQQNVTGNMNGQPFEGLGLTGFDNMRQEYMSVWLDNMNTGMMVGSGTAD